MTRFNTSLILACFFLFFPFISKASELGTRDSVTSFLNSGQKCYDVHYYHLNLSVDIAAKSISGSNDIYFKAEEDFSRIRVDLFSNMLIDSIVCREKKLCYTRDVNTVFIYFPETVRKGNYSHVRVFYHGIPVVAKNAPWEGGFVWDKDSLNNDWVGVACQGEGASLWWPCKDHPSDEADSMHISITCPAALKAVCNGSQEGVFTDGSTATYLWKINYPVNNYNVTLNIGNYAHFSDTLRRPNDTWLALDYYILSYNLEKAKKHFEQVKQILTAFEYYFGEYPFAKDGYALVETPYWGMEHQSAIAYGNNYQNNLGPFDFIIVHETAHEWWGNSLTAKDLGELWLHEAFATYAESLLLEYYFGKAKALKYLSHQQEKINNEMPMLLPAGTFQPEDTDIYYKGTWLLETLRTIADNDKRWFGFLKTLCLRRRHSIITTDEVISLCCKYLGQDLRPVFKQYLENASPPVFEYALKKVNGRLVISYRWRSEVKNFKMPVWILAGGKKIMLNCQTKFKQKVLGVTDPEVVRVMKETEYILVEKKQP